MMIFQGLSTPANSYCQTEVVTHMDTICLQKGAKLKPHYIMGPLIEVVREAAQSENPMFQSLAGHLATAVTPFLEEEAANSVDNAAWALSQGMSFPQNI